MYRNISKFKPSKFFSRLSKHIQRYGLSGSTLLVSIEVVWLASIIVPVLFVVGALFNYTNAWLSILPGLLGALTFMIILVIGGLAATLPSSYVARLREKFIARIEQNYPAQVVSNKISPIPSVLSDHLEIQDAD